MVSSLSSSPPLAGSGSDAGSHPASAAAPGQSTGHTNLKKILAIISTVPEVPFTKTRNTPLDLRLRLAPTWEEDHDAGLIASACSVVVGEETANAPHQIVSESFSYGLLGANSSKGECDDEVRGGKREDEEEGKPSSDITNARGNDGSEERCSPVDATWRKNNTKTSEEGYLGLLLDAVRQVSGELFGMEEEEEREAAEKKAKETKDMAQEPVVRSKRGRSQVLPSRYRDSVLEPWSKQARRWR